jgi:hypothetical protein
MRLIPPTAGNRTQLALAETIFLRCLLTRVCHLLLWCVVLLQPGVGKAELPAGPWKFSGIVNDDLKGANGSVVMHQTLTVSGYFENGSFILTVDPQKSPQNIWESAGWDGKLLRVVQNFSDKPGPGQPRSRWLGTVEPNVFSRHATPATTSILMAFADTNILASMRQGGELIILGERRLYPEENNTYEIKEFPSGGLEIQATCPGQKVARGGNTPISGLEHGFTRWTYHSIVDKPDSPKSIDSFKLKTEFEQFRPVNGRLLTEHHITGNLDFEKSEAKVTNFWPEISQDAMQVWDYSMRPLIYPLNKGAVDQACVYTLTNHIWNFSQELKELITNRAKDFKALVLREGIPPKSLDVEGSDTNAPYPRHNRVGVLVGLGIISALFAWMLLRQWRASRISQKEKEQK